MKILGKSAAKALEAFVAANGIKNVEDRLTPSALKDAGVEGRAAKLIAYALSVVGVDYVVHDVAIGADLARNLEDDCLVRADAATELALLFSDVFSPGKLEKAKAKADKGFKALKGAEWAFSADIEAKWHEGGNTAWTLTLSWEAEVKVDDYERFLDAFRDFREDHPMADAEEIREIVNVRLESAVQEAFEDYCDLDEYYEPYVPDFELDHYLNEEAKTMGLVVEVTDREDGEVDWEEY